MYSSILRGGGGRKRKERTLNFLKHSISGASLCVFGTIGQNSSEFGGLNSQCTSCSVVALCAAFVNPPSNWSPSYTDSIIRTGHDIHLASLKKFLTPPMYLAADEVLSEIRFQDHLFQISYLPEPYQGNSSECFLLEVRRFFDNHSLGVLTVNSLSVALVRENKKIWVIDSHNRL